MPGSTDAIEAVSKEVFEVHADWQWRFLEERDRRYAETQVLRDRAEVIAREYQTYKDRQANELREQLGVERVGYASKGDLVSAVATLNAVLEPIVRWVAAQQGSRQGGLDARLTISWVITAALGVWALVQALS